MRIVYEMVAEIIQNELNRPCDFVARYGGEEFAVILPRTDQEVALHVAEGHIEKLQIPHLESKMKPVVTVSIGVATLITSIFSNLSQLVERADHALYTAKNKEEIWFLFTNPNWLVSSYGACHQGMEKGSTYHKSISFLFIFQQYKTSFVRRLKNLRLPRKYSPH
jgi:GGDEF domain-containing protein